MLMKRAKTIDELYDEVKDYDLVIVSDMPLCTALNARVRRPMLGPFCMTARNIARMLAIETLGKPMISDMELIKAISEDSGIDDLRFIHGEIQNIREIMRYQAEPEGFLYSKKSKRVLESFRRMPALENVMSGFDSNDSLFYQRMKKVAVVGSELFDNLDKNMTPHDLSGFTTIDPFTDGSYRMERIYEIGNDRQIAENAVSLIDPSKATEYAIVLNPDSPVLDAVKAALYRRGIPFVNELKARDIPQIRDYLEFIRMSLDYDVLRGRHVREMFSYFGGRIAQKDDNYLLSRILEEDLDSRGEELRDAMIGIRSMTYGGLAELLMPGCSKGSLEAILDRIGMRDDAIARDGYATVLYLIDNIDFAHQDEVEDDERRGVLIADCMDSAYIDRSVVFFLGMDRSWNLDVSGKRYLEPMDVIENNAIRTEILLQQGDVRMYFVNATKKGGRVEPSQVFGAMSGLDDMPKDSGGSDVIIRTFDDLLPDGQSTDKVRWTDGMVKCAVERGESLVDADERYSEPFSPSSFDLFVTCPWSFVFRNLIRQDEKDTLLLGTLVHEFAELYVTHPEVVEEKGIEHFLRIIAGCYSGLSSPSLGDLDADRVRMEITGVKEFLDKNGIRAESLDKPLEGDSNRLMGMEGLGLSSKICEMSHTSERHPMKGRFDLYWKGAVIDYKSSLKARTAGDMIKCITHEGKLGKYEYLDFQPLFYLALAMDMGDSAMSFSQFYPMQNLEESVKGGYDYRRNLRTARMVDGTIEGYIRTMVQKSASENMGKELSDVEYMKMVEAVIEEEGSEDPTNWKNNDNLRAAICSKASLDKKRGTLVVKKYIEMKQSESKNKGLFINGDSVDVPLESLESFIAFIEQKHIEMMEGSNSTYDRSPLSNCEDCEYRAICTRDIIYLDWEANANE